MEKRGDDKYLRIRRIAVILYITKKDKEILEKGYEVIAYKPDIKPNKEINNIFLVVRKDRYEIEPIDDKGAFKIKLKTNQYRDWETDRKSTRLNSSHSAKSRMPSSA